MAGQIEALTWLKELGVACRLAIAPNISLR